MFIALSVLSDLLVSVKLIDVESYASLTAVLANSQLAQPVAGLG